MKKIFCLSIAATIMLGACNTTHLISSWKAPNTTAQQYKKVLVIGLTGKKDVELRQPIEDAMAKMLRDKGINVETSTQAYGPKSFRTMSEDDAVKMVNDKGFDGVVVVALLDKKQESSFAPGYVSTPPNAVVQNRWYGNYSVMYDRVYNPGYYTTTTDYVLEADFYKTRGDKLIYSAQTKSFDPTSAENLAGDFSKTVVKDMIGKGVIKK